MPIPNSNVQFGSGASLNDPIPPTLSKNYVYSTVCDLVRLLSHTSGNTTVITNAEVLSIVLDFTAQIQKENWQILSPNYLQSNTFTIISDGGLYKSSVSLLSPYIDKFISALLLQGTNRVPIKILSSEELGRFSKLTTTHANSVLGTMFDSYIQLYVGSFITTPTDYLTEIYYFRQPTLASITTSNYTTKYVDLPDSFIPELIDRSVLQIERTK